MRWRSGALYGELGSILRADHGRQCDPDHPGRAMTVINENLVAELLKKAGAPPGATKEELAALTVSLSEIANYASMQTRENSPKVKKRGEYLDEGDKLRCNLKDPRPLPRNCA